jgi:hypothetical protein
MYDYVIVTHLPVFYKVNLYNALSEHLNIYVIFLGAQTNEQRGSGFSKEEEASFEYTVIFNGSFQDRNKLFSTIVVLKKLKEIRFKQLIVSGWDLPEFWLSCFVTPKSSNCLALESSVIESRTVGIKSWLKKLFLLRISKVFASGQMHAELLEQLSFRGDIRVTYGVGLINKPKHNVINKVYARKYLFIGRLVEAKNLHYLINVFNGLPEYSLSIVGQGPLEKELKGIANSNICFLDSVNNNQIKSLFEAHDILILPSVSEPWGLVIEEALYFGVPVIVSNKCGVSSLVNDLNGAVFELEEEDSLLRIMQSIDQQKYDSLLAGVKGFSIESKDVMQVEAYVD